VTGAGAGAAPGEGTPAEEAAAPGEQPVFRIAILASGSGSNLQALIDDVHGRAAAGAPSSAAAARGAAQAAPLIEIVLVISDVPGARALRRAADAGIPTATIPSADYPDRTKHDLAVVAALQQAAPDLVVLAGYMRVVTPPLLEAFPYRVINLHPALLPCFPGAHAIPDAIAYGVKVTGVTVHFVDTGVDTGPVIAQEAVIVEEGDTADTLATRIHAVEHRLLPHVVRLIAAGKVRPPLPGTRVVKVD
jgi:phosphoribosylglycinamide formyltransferase 1